MYYRVIAREFSDDVSNVPYHRSTYSDLIKGVLSVSLFLQNTTRPPLALK